jgi:sulfhydrogenase subunit alpha
MANVQVEVHHLTRVEGHGNIVVDVAGGRLERCDLEIIETPRFFEPMLRGRPYTEASHLTSRICGICSVGHATTSLQATEAALGVVPSEQTRRLRQINFFGEIMDSHVLHTYMLVAPDLVGAGSVFPLARTHPEVVLRALRLKKLAGDLCAVIGGRHTHPLTLAVGGFTHLPQPRELEALRAQLEAARPDLEATVALYQSLSLPAFERETEYVALHQPDEYAFIGGEIRTSDGFTLPLTDYRQLTNEFYSEHSTAKHARHHRDAYMVGALARFNLNYDQLHPRAQAAAAALGLKPICINPYMISVAQVVEIVHCVETAIVHIDRLLAAGLKEEEPPQIQVRAGEGVGACEVPRGTLFHHYRIDDEGKVAWANCIIPTGQNLANIEADMRALVPQIMALPQDDIRLRLEMLVRAYDPCISCSTHMLEVAFA